MRILQVGTGFASLPPTGAYGTERTIHFLSSALVTLGHKVTVLDIENKNRPGVPYQVEEVRSRWHRDSNLAMHILRGLAYCQVTQGKLRELLVNGNFDIVNFHNEFSAWHIPLVRKCNVSTVYTLHNPLWYDSTACRSPWQRLKFFPDIRAMRKSNIVVCLNNIISSNITDYFDISKNKNVVIPNGISAEWFIATAVPESLRAQYAPRGEQIVLNVARISPYKNQMTLAKAIPLVLKEVPRVRFLFVGPISDQGYFQQICHVLDDTKVTQYASFIGEVPYIRLPEFYSFSDLAVFPSVSEAMPTVTLEAMAQGKTVVTSDIQPFLELSREGIGITVSSFNHVALANAITNMLINKSLREERGQKAREYVKVNYTWESVANKIIAVYENIIGGNI